MYDIEHKPYITCDEDELFVLTKLGYDAMTEEQKLENQIGKPMNGFERAIPEHFYVRGYFAKVFEDEVK